MGVLVGRTAPVSRIIAQSSAASGVLHRAGIASASRKADPMNSGLKQFKRIFIGARKAACKTLDRATLPTPTRYLTDRGLLKRTPRGGWAAISCPVHKGGNESKASLRVNLADGHFKCMACGASGGDIIALHRLIAGVGFIDAVRELGGRFDG